MGGGGKSLQRCYMKTLWPWSIFHNSNYCESLTHLSGSFIQRPGPIAKLMYLLDTIKLHIVCYSSRFCSLFALGFFWTFTFLIFPSLSSIFLTNFLMFLTVSFINLLTLLSFWLLPCSLRSPLGGFWLSLMFLIIS